MTADLSALIARLEAAEVGSRELDGEIALAFDYPRDVWGETFDRPFAVDGPAHHNDAATWSGEGKMWSAPAFTTSLDAALALAERVGWRLYSLDASIIGRTSTMLQSVDDKPGTDPETGAVLIGKAFSCGFGNTPALALVIALLRAKQGEG